MRTDFRSFNKDPVNRSNSPWKAADIATEQRQQAFIFS
jgi:hypothetical protein